METTIEELAHLRATLTSQAERYHTLTDEYTERSQLLKDAINTMWLITMGSLVFFMQAGFAMFESGSISRASGILHILLKNITDVCVGGFAWYLVGYGIAFGDSYGAGGNPGIGDSYYATEGIASSPTISYAHWFFQFTFANTATTIVSGAVCERTQVQTYLAFASFSIFWIYPIIVHWVWSTDGWLSAFAPEGEQFLGGGLYDFAGSGVVHVTGGTAGLIGAVVVGSRYKRWDKGYVEKGVFNPNDLSWMALGTLILWFGWIGFNCGSTIVIVGFTRTAGLVAVNTIISPSFAGAVAILLGKWLDGSYQLGYALNGILIGLVGVTAGCAFVDPWASVIIGFVSGIIYIIGSKFLIRFHIDDPVEASVVHGVGGFWGLVATGLFATRENTTLVTTRGYHYGAFMGGGGQQLLMQVLGGLVIMAWVSFWAVIFFVGAHKLDLLRISRTKEKQMFQQRLDDLARQKIHMMSQLPEDFKFNNHDGSLEAEDMEDRVEVGDLSDSTS